MGDVMEDRDTQESGYIAVRRKLIGDDYVMVPHATAVEICDEAPLEASCIVTMHGGYVEAVAAVQQFLDSRLDSYGLYRQMVPDDYDFEPAVAESTLENLSLSVSKSKKGVDDTAPKLFVREQDAGCMRLDDYYKRGVGYRGVSQVDNQSWELLRLLENNGVLYAPHGISYGVKYLGNVAPLGDCLFLAMEQVLLSAEGCKPATPSDIRIVAVETFWQHYCSSTVQERQKMDSTIRNLYHPDLTRGWGISQMQTRRFIALKKRRDELVSRIVALQERGFSWNAAAEAVYSTYGYRVANAETYCEYMKVGTGESRRRSEYYLVSMHYSAQGLVSVDDDPDERRVAWGDDIALEALATAYKRDIFVVLLGCGKMFFLPHRPRPSEPNASAEEVVQGRAPWFLLMRSTGGERGGDHYEPMGCARLRGDACEEFGVIGD